jgi:hypothetical protein
VVVERLHKSSAQVTPIPFTPIVAPGPMSDQKPKDQAWGQSSPVVDGASNAIPFIARPVSSLCWNGAIGVDLVRPKSVSCDRGRLWCGRSRLRATGVGFERPESALVRPVAVVCGRIKCAVRRSLPHEGTAPSRGGAWPPAVLDPLEGTSF